MKKKELKKEIKSSLHLLSEEILHMNFRTVLRDRDSRI